MWDDEDNNPYGSFHRRDSETSDVPQDRACRLSQYRLMIKQLTLYTCRLQPPLHPSLRPLLPRPEPQLRRPPQRPER